MLQVDCVFGHHGAAVGDLHQEFRAGNLCAIAGPNGSGKSTLLQTIAGELEPVSGIILVRGEAPSVGFSIRIADPVFLPDLTVGEHLMLLADRQGLDYQRTVQTWELADLPNRFPATLSSGQRQRVYLACHLENDEEVLLLDEPERHLDTSWLEFLAEQLVDRARQGTLVLIATHSAILLSACDTVVYL